MNGWSEVDLQSLPQFSADIRRLVQHVYKERGRALRGSGTSMHWTQVKVRYKTSQPHTAYVQIADRWEDAPGASMVCPLSSSPRCRTTSLTCSALLDTIAYDAHVQVYSVNAESRLSSASASAISMSH